MMTSLYREFSNAMDVFEDAPLDAERAANELVGFAKEIKSSELAQIQRAVNVLMDCDTNHASWEWAYRFIESHCHWGD